MRILILGNSKLTVSDIAEKLNEGDILRENQLVSTSLPIMGRTPFVKICDNTTFKLKTTPEVKGVWLGKKTDETKGISSMPNENEILLPVGTKYQIKSIKVKPPEGFSMEKKLEIEADLLPPSP
jgi:hypothetical protein